MRPVKSILSYTKKLKEAGESEKIAEAHAEIIAALIDTDLATKNDFKALEAAFSALEITVKNEIQALAATTKNNAQAFETNIRNDFQALAATIKNDAQAFETNIRNDFQALATSTQSEFKIMRGEIKAFDSKLNWLIGLASVFGSIIALGNSLSAILHNHLI